MNLLSVQNVRKTYYIKNRTVHALRGVSLELNAGKSLGIIGESGSGKSTLAKLICRLERPDSGQVLLEGENISGLSGRKMRRIYQKVQMVFQNPAASFDPRRTIGASLKEVIRNFRSRHTVEELLLLTGLPAEYAIRYPAQLSGGECQRAAVARALASDPALLICDEATSALDVSVQAQILHLLTDLKSQTGISYLVISHDPAVVNLLCEYTLVLYAGTVLESGPTAEVLHDPLHPYTKLLISAAFGEGLPDVKAGESAEEDNGCPFASRCPEAQLNCWENVPVWTERVPGHGCACHWSSEERS